MVELTFLTLERQHPPIRRLRFDVTLQNPAAAPRWFLLPATLSSAPVAGGVYAVEVYALGDEPQVIVGHFLGVGGFQALRLPAGGAVTIRGLPIRSFEELDPARLELPVTVCERLTIGGDPAEQWFGRDPTSPAAATVASDHRRMLFSRKTPDLQSLPVATEGAAVLLVRPERGG